MGFDICGTGFRDWSACLEKVACLECLAHVECLEHFEKANPKVKALKVIKALKIFSTAFVDHLPSWRPRHCQTSALSRASAPSPDTTSRLFPA